MTNSSLFAVAMIDEVKINSEDTVNSGIVSSEILAGISAKDSLSMFSSEENSIQIANDNAIAFPSDGLYILDLNGSVYIQDADSPGDIENTPFFEEIS